MTNSLLLSAHNEFGRTLQTYTDGYGPLFILRDSMGILGIIQASTWEDAWSIAEDEFFPEADEATWEAIAQECDCANPEELMDNAIFQDAYGFRPNGRNSGDKHGHGIYQRDLNGEALDQVTEAILASRYDVTVTLQEGE
jgi:hypothetical protein